MSRDPWNAEVVGAHVSNYPNPLDLRLGDRVALGRADEEYPGWIWVESSEGNAGWAPERLIERTGEKTGVLKDDYCARELNTEVSQHLECHREIDGWVWASSEYGETGWVPRALIRAL